MDKFYVRGIDKEGDECFYTGKAGAGFAHWDRANAYYGYTKRQARAMFRQEVQS